MKQRSEGGDLYSPLRGEIFVKQKSGGGDIARGGVEPPYVGTKNRCLTTWLPGSTIKVSVDFNFALDKMQS